jgi:hypothetical protein
MIQPEHGRGQAHASVDSDFNEFLLFKSQPV